MGTMDLNLLPLFVAVAEHGGFSAAAAKLGLPKSSVSRGVSQLEALTQKRLFHRTTRKVALTDAGERLYESVAPQLAALRSALASSADDDREPSGRVRLTATVDFAATVLAEIVARFVARHPRVEIDLRLSNAMLDLVAEGIDLAFRASTRRMTSSSLKAQRIGRLHLGLYAAAPYLARSGTPRVPGDLAAHEFVLFGPLRRKLALVSDAGETQLAPRGRVQCDDMLFAREAARRGAGIAVLPTFLASEDLTSGALVRVLPRWRMNSGNLWVVMPGGERLPAAVSAFKKFALESMRES